MHPCTLCSWDASSVLWPGFGTIWIFTRRDSRTCVPDHRLGPLMQEPGGHPGSMTVPCYTPSPRQSPGGPCCLCSKINALVSPRSCPRLLRSGLLAVCLAPCLASPLLLPGHASYTSVLTCSPPSLLPSVSLLAWREGSGEASPESCLWFSLFFHDYSTPFFSKSLELPRASSPALGLPFRAWRLTGRTEEDDISRGL